MAVAAIDMEEEASSVAKQLRKLRDRVRIVKKRKAGAEVIAGRGRAVQALVQERDAEEERSAEEASSVAKQLRCTESCGRVHVITRHKCLC